MDIRTLFERLEGRFEGAGNLAIRCPREREMVRLSDSDWHGAWKCIPYLRQVT